MKKCIVTLVAPFLLLVSSATSSCKKDDPQPDNNPPAGGVKIPLSGHYVWKFEIPNVGAQESHLVFYTDSVQYVMTGPAYSTNYIMYTESYMENGDEKRWIGTGKGGSISKDGVYFIMFFKDITDSTVTIYKHECKDGKAEAESFAYPADDATEDHGWNVYDKK